jgi:prepilin-type N-terminal cleavage/methylation domain-containing protein/prepilin-type processing-associated H-X9-DG protein
MNNSRRAFSLLELLVVAAIVGLIAVLLVPSTGGGKATASRINCANNLKMIGISTKEWAMDHNNLFPMQTLQPNGEPVAASGLPWRHFQVMSNELRNPKVFVCPADNSRRAATNFTSDFSNSRLSYFLNVTAQYEDTNNMSSFLSGDRNLLVDGNAPGGEILIRTNSMVSWSEQIHRNNGNILLIDGSVQQLSAKRLLESVREATSEQKMRLAFP